MHFPMVFRVFGIINLLFFITLLFQAIVQFQLPNPDFLDLVLTGAACVWLLVASFFWLFASQLSFACLIPTIICLLLWASSAAFGFLENPSLNASASYYNLLSFMAGLVYAGFLVITLFRQPVKRWQSEVTSRKKLDVKLTSFFVACFLISGLSFFYLGIVMKRPLVIDEVSSYNPLGDQCFDFTLHYYSGFNELAINVDDPDAPDNVQAVIYFSDNNDASGLEDFTQSETVTFQKREGRYVADFKTTMARKIAVCFNNTSGPSRINLITIVKHVNYFNSDATKEGFIYEEVSPQPVPGAIAVSEEEGMEEGYEDYPDSSFKPEKTTHEDGTPNDLQAKDALDLIENFFFQVIRDKYAASHFNTSRNEVSLGENIRYGSYQDFRSLFSEHLAGALNAFIRNHYGVSEEQTSLNEAVFKISGVNLYNTDPYEGTPLPFNRLNPQFVQWLSNEMVLANDETVFDESVALHQIYTSIFRRTFWMLATSYDYLHEEGRLETETQMYWEAMNNPGFNGTDYLWQRFGNKDFSATPFQRLYLEFPPNEPDQYFHFNEDTALGFWMRRELDGSSKDVHELMVKIMTNYDSYYSELVD